MSAENPIHARFFDGDDLCKRDVIEHILSGHISPNEVTKATLIEIIRWMRDDSHNTARSILLTVEDIQQEVLPTVIWVEFRISGEVIAGVWQEDHYEMEDGGTMDSLSEEIADETYNRKWRVWYMTEPLQRQMDEEEWED